MIIHRLAAFSNGSEGGNPAGVVIADELPSRSEMQRIAKDVGYSETAFAACGCRDYARLDYMLSEEGELYFLEINTLPGMKETSLLPMSARCVGLDFNALCRELVAPAVERFRGRLPAKT